MSYIPKILYKDVYPVVGLQTQEKMLEEIKIDSNNNCRSKFWHVQEKNY